MEQSLTCFLQNTLASEWVEILCLVAVPGWFVGWSLLPLKMHSYNVSWQKPDSERPETSCQEQLIEDTLLSQQYTELPVSRWKDETHSPSNLCYAVLVGLLPYRDFIFVFVPGLVPNQFTTITWPQPAPSNAPDHVSGVPWHRPWAAHVTRHVCSSLLQFSTQVSSLAYGHCVCICMSSLVNYCENWSWNYRN